MPNGNKPPIVDWTKPEFWPSDWYKNLPKSNLLGGRLSTTLSTMLSTATKGTGTFAGQQERWNYESIRWQAAVKQVETGLGETELVPDTSWWTQIPSAIVSAGKLITGAPGRPGLAPSPEQSAATMDSLNKKKTVYSGQFERSELMIGFYRSVESVVSAYSITSAADFLALKGYSAANLTPEDIAEMDATIKKLAGRSPTELPPDTEKQITEYLTGKIKITPGLPHVVTVDEVVKSLTGQLYPLPKYPENITDTEMLSFMSRHMGLTDEQKKELQDNRNLLDPYLDALKAQQEDILAIQSGAKDWEMPSLSFGEQMLFALNSPMQQLNDAFEPYMRHVIRPLSGLAVWSIQQLISGTQGMEKEYNDARAAGKNMWDAFGTGWEEYDLSWWQKMPIEMVLDPLNFFPGWGLSIPGRAFLKAGTKLGAVGGFGFRIAGYSMLSFDEGLWHLSDIPFDKLKFGLSKLNKTLRMKAEQGLGKLEATWYAAFGKYTEVFKNGGKAYAIATDKELVEMCNYSRLATALHPDDTDNVLVGLGKYLDATAPLDTNAIGRLSKTLGGNLKASEVTDEILEEINDILVDVASKRDFTIAAKKLLMSLDINDNFDSVAKVAKYLSDYVEESANLRIAQLSKLIGTPNSKTKILDALISQQSQIYRLYEKSAYAATKRTTGAMAAMVNMVDRLELAGWRVAMDKWFNRPLVSAYLASPTVAIGNMLESLLVQFPEGIVGGAASRAEFLNIFQGLMVDPKLIHAALRGRMAGEPALILNQIRGKVSILPSYVLGEKVMGVTMPKFLEGKDALAVFGKTWLDLADYWGTAFRMGAMTKLYTKYLAEKATNVLGRDIMSELRTAIKGAPAINPALKLTTKDIEHRAFLAGLTDMSGKSLRALKEEINSVILLRKRLEEIVRVHGMDLLPETKASLYEDIAKHGLFKEGVIPKLFDWDKIKFVDLRLEVGVDMSPEIVTRLQNIVDGLPYALKAEIRAIKIDPTLAIRGDYGSYNPSTKTIKLTSRFFDEADAKILAAEGRSVEETLLHEVWHAFLDNNWANGDYSILINFMEDALANNTEDVITSITTKSGTYVKGYWRTNLDIMKEYLASVKTFSVPEADHFYTVFHDVHELIALEFGKYASGKRATLKSSGDFFSRTLPKRSPGKSALHQAVERAFAIQSAGFKHSNFSISKRFKEFVDRVLEDPVDSPQRYAENLYNYIAMIDTQHNSVQKMILSIANDADVARAAKKYGEVSSIWDKGRQQVETAINEINDSMSRYKAHLVSTSGALENDVQKTAVDALLADIDERVASFGKYLDAHQADVQATWNAIRAVKKMSPEEKSAIWDEFWLRDAARRDAYVNEDAQLFATSLLSRQKWANLINKVPKPNPPPTIHLSASTPLHPELLARAMGCGEGHVSAFYQSFLQVSAMQSKPHFIQMVMVQTKMHPNYLKGFTEENIGKVYDDIIEKLALDPGQDISEQIAFRQLSDIKKRIEYLQISRGMTPEQEAALHKYIDDAASKVQKVFGGDKNLQGSWQKLRQEAADEASKTYYKMYADYTNQSLVNRFGRMIFPFWTYHNYRWFWLARTGLRHPGYVSAWNKYYDHTEQGAIDIPGFDLAVNPVAGTVLGPLVGLARKDYPAYYENLGWGAEVLNTMQKVAYFPAPSIMTIPYMSTAFKGGKMEMNNLLPPVSRLGLNLLIKSEIPGVANFAKSIQEHVFHDNFRDYYKASMVDNIQAKSGSTRAEGISGSDLWDKVQAKTPLSPDEQSLWDEVEQTAAYMSMLRAWFPLFRYKPKAATEFYNNIDKIFISYGFTTTQLKWLQAHGMKPSDVMGGETFELKLTLDELWETRLWRGKSKMLLPEETRAILMKQDDYYGAIKSLQERRLTVQKDIEYRFLHPLGTAKPMTPDEYRAAYRENWSNYSEGVRRLNEDDSRFNYPDFQALLTPEGQVELYKRTGNKPPVRGPAEEIIDLYFGIQLEDKRNKYTGEIEPDYLGFVMKRRTVIDACPPDYQADFLTIINKYDTDLMKKLEWAMDTYVSGYLAIPRIVFETYDEESKALIEEYNSSRVTDARKEEIREEIDPKTGNQLISAYESALTEARRRMRVNSSDLDFWLFVYGYTTKPKTPTAQAKVDVWEQDRTSILR